MSATRVGANATTRPALLASAYRWKSAMNTANLKEKRIANRSLTAVPQHKELEEVLALGAANVASAARIQLGRPDQTPLATQAAVG